MKRASCKLGRFRRFTSGTRPFKRKVWGRYQWVGSTKLATPTADVARAHRVAQAVKAGAVGVNCWAQIDARLPWGGMKTSGIGRECGLSGVRAYTKEKVITVFVAVMRGGRGRAGGISTGYEDNDLAHLRLSL